MTASFTMPARRTRSRGRRALFLALSVGVLSATLGVGAPARGATPIVYHVDCSAGSDSAAGTSPSTAWRSIGRANKATLAPGDKLLLKRGCTWSGATLFPKWNGTASLPITIGAYGTGALPKLQNAQDQLYIQGSYLVIDSIQTRADPVTYDTQCGNARAGRRTGFRFVGPANHNIVRNSVADDLFIGIKVDTGAHHTTIVNNTLRNNNMKSDVFSSDAGAVGIALLGDDNEVAYNNVTGSDVCSRFYGRDGSTVEVYGGQRNRIHHNRASQNHIFTELGHSRSADNTFTYNRVTSTLDTGRFLTTRGSGDSSYGPVLRTKAHNNSVYLTGANSGALTCMKGCSSSILSFRNNVIWATKEIGYADAAFDEGNNIYWQPGGVTRLYFPITSSSRKADPRYVNAGAGDLHLQATSPAVNMGSNVTVNLGYTTDLDGVAVPQAGMPDAGAYERPTATSTTTYASDGFNRSVTDSWGWAATGGSYTSAGGTSNLDVNGAAGTIRVGSSGAVVSAYLPSVSARDVNARFRVKTDRLATGEGQFVHFLARRTAEGTEYRSKVHFMPSGEVRLQVSSAVNGVTRALGLETTTPLTHAANAFYWVRVQVTGVAPTTVRMRIWRDGQTEPTTWQFVGTDSTAALQVAGGVGLRGVLGANVTNGATFFSFDDWSVTN